MGRRSSPAGVIDRGRAGRARPLTHCVLTVFVVAAFALAAEGLHAQTLSERIAGKAQPQAGKPTDRMLVNADELTYDHAKNTVTASGNVQVYYQGRVLQADHVIYDRAADRVYAEGHAKLTDQDGSVAYAERFDLTDDFKNGFIESLSVDTADKTHFTAPRATRADGETTVFEDGTYTACQACKDHPDRPPLWQIRAKRIIHKNDEQMLYYEDADFEFLGVPIAYLPYLSAPDPSVKQKSGVLAPHYITKSGLGFGVGIPIYWALAPDYDLTVTPTFLTRQGVLGSAEWRQKFINGSYNIRASGIFELEPDAFSQPPYGAGDQQWRGSLQSTGQFLLNDKWKFGWDATILSDKWFLQDYDLTSQTLTSNFFKESASTIYLTGQAGRGYFDLRGYYFQGLAQTDLQAQQPVVAPVLDYHKTFDLNPAQTAGIGGQAEIDANVTHLAQDLATFQSTRGLQ
ncbi:MAG TPA: LPS assembly protein LptD, partial [Beijerinckiaceae bacterium]|nr:LPS assembly protein LptD [Beijerinckiaceae bacterium]